MYVIHFGPMPSPQVFPLYMNIPSIEPTLYFEQAYLSEHFMRNNSIIDSASSKYFTNNILFWRLIIATLQIISPFKSDAEILKSSELFWTTFLSNVFLM